MISLRPIRLTVLGISLGLAGLALSAPAMAHVSVNPGTAEQGTYATLTFRVPVESETASTTKLQVAFPAEHPFASVRTKPVPGWTARVQTTGADADDKAVSAVVWTADSAATALKPGEFGEFDISLGPLPEADSLTFKAVQTYSDGTVSRWIETPADGVEAERPAPVLTLTEGTGGGHHATSDGHGGASEGNSARADHSADQGAERDTDSRAPLVLSILALVTALGVAGATVLRRRG